MATFSALLTVPEAAALLAALGRYADDLDDDPTGVAPRTRAQKMADCLLDLVLRPGESDRPSVQAHMTVVAPVPTFIGGDQPGEIAGEPVPAEMVRALARGLGLLPDVAPSNTPEAAFASGGPPCEARTEDDPETQALEAWWSEVEARALRGEWGGEDAPPPEELERLWAGEASLADGSVGVDPAERGNEGAAREGAAPEGGDGDEDRDGEVDESCTAPPVTVPSWWAAADRAVGEAGAALLDLDRRLARARGAVETAEIVEAADEDAWQQSAAAQLSSAADALSALASASACQRALLARLLDSSRGGGLADRPRIAVTDALTGALLALTDAGELREFGTCGRRACRRGRVACTHDLSERPGLGPPRRSPTYRPGAALDRFVRARDRRCRFPGCRNRVPLSGELDHDRPWPDGPTAAGNLTGYCTGHHRGKHQAPGWLHALSSDGTLTVRTPSGLTASTTPAPY
jgi:hypothetical protein